MSTFVHFTDMNRVVLVEYFFGGGRDSKKSILFAHYIEELSIHVHCT